MATLMNISLCITTYQRYDLLLESFQHVLNNPRITEIIIVDDCSLPEYWKKIEQLPKLNDKIKVYRQAANRGMSRNKADAIAYASNEWVIILDSDNVIDDRYLVGLDAIENPVKDLIYMPSFAWPNFDYRGWAGSVYFKSSAAALVWQDTFNMLLNTCNFFVNRDEYARVYQENPAHRASDTIWMNYLWLKAGNGFYVVPDCTYFHRVHDGSGFMEQAAYNMAQAENVRKLISEL